MHYLTYFQVVQQFLSSRIYFELQSPILELLAIVIQFEVEVHKSLSGGVKIQL